MFGALLFLREIICFISFHFRSLTYNERYWSKAISDPLLLLATPAFAMASSYDRAITVFSPGPDPTPLSAHPQPDPLRRRLSEDPWRILSQGSSVCSLAVLPRVVVQMVTCSKWSTPWKPCARDPPLWRCGRKMCWCWASKGNRPPNCRSERGSNTDAEREETQEGDKRGMALALHVCIRRSEIGRPGFLCPPLLLPLNPVPLSSSRDLLRSPRLAPLSLVVARNPAPSARW